MDGAISVRKAGLGGIKDRIVNGKQFGAPRRVSWPKQMQKEHVEALDIYWYVTHSDKYSDCPRILEHTLLTIHRDIHGCLPDWNNES